MSLDNVIIEDNHACFDGGAIYSSGTLTATGSLVEANSAAVNIACIGSGSDGGGLYNDGGDVTIVDTTIRLNEAFGSGGGIFTTGGSLNITDSLIELNIAGAGSNLIGSGGGGIYGFDTDIEITNSVVQLNEVNVGTVVMQASGGGGIYVANSTLVVSERHSQEHCGRYQCRYLHRWRRRRWHLQRREPGGYRPHEHQSQRSPDSAGA